MTERRATITRNWRAAGAPARRLDDFVEIPAAVACPADEPAPQPERRDIESRLMNWAKWCTSEWGTYPRDSGPTAAACRILEEAALGPRASNGGERRQIDEVDAAAIERGLWNLSNLQRDMLRLHYVWGRPWYGICHIVGIRARRGIFDNALSTARHDLSLILERSQ